MNPSEMRQALKNVTKVDGKNDRISLTQPKKREYISSNSDSWYLTASMLGYTRRDAIAKLGTAVGRLDTYMTKLGYVREYRSEFDSWDIARNVKKITYDYQRQHTRVSVQLVYSREGSNVDG